MGDVVSGVALMAGVVVTGGVVNVGENAHAHLAIGKPMNVITGGQYMVDESSMGYIGCFLFGSLESTWIQMGNNNWWQYMTPGMCTQACHDSGFAYAAMWYYSYCYCGDSYGSSGWLNTAWRGPRSGSAS